MNRLLDIGAKRLVLLVTFIGVTCAAMAQDLNARVQILSPQVQNTNKRMLDVLEKAISDFLNNRTWSTNEVGPQERIDCSLVLTITAWDGSSNFTAQAQIISTRPVYNTTYNSPVLSISDDNFNFSYTEGQLMDYSDQQFMGNLTSLLAYYAYVIVGLDADTFAHNGGTPFYAAAQNIVNYSQNTGFNGWRSMEGTNNRFWLVNNLQDRRYQPIRDFLYSFYLDGMDKMADNTQEARKAVFNLLPLLQKVDRLAQGAVFNQVFFTAKSDELVGVCSGLAPQERMQAYNILAAVDPANASKYENLRNSR
ncbi:type IX secretion system protein PorD [Parapedobacter lycopersici]|uniref:type IX secretion system protein PorD n=1 Tax=Parapedobacter lycopersici TaxID=1864939 RepID=UPI003FD78D05